MSAAASTKGSDRPLGGVKAPAPGGGRALPGGAAGRDMGAGRTRRFHRGSDLQSASTQPHPAPHDQIVAAPSGCTDAIPTLYRRDTDAVLSGSGRAK
jgi:hypothetical protein